MEPTDGIKPTHINAFYQDVEDAKQRLAVAVGELDSAVSRLQAHPDYVAPVVEKAPKKKTKVEKAPVEASPPAAPPVPGDVVKPSV